MLQEILDLFEPVDLGVYVDGTLGAGGHARAIAETHPEMQLLCGIDVDPTAHEIAGGRINALASAPEFHALRGNYCDMPALLATVPGRALQEGGCNGILMDLGVSSMQVDRAERGFSFIHDGPIDMRMDPDAALSAEELLNTAPEAELCRILRDYGEEKMWRLVARRIVHAREEAPITSTMQLVKVIGDTKVWNKGKRKKGKAKKALGKDIHPATRTFQALRIAVNDELNRLEQALPAAIDCLAPGGRLGVISFHSLEDRIVKRAFMSAAGRGGNEPDPKLPAYLALMEPPPEPIVKLVTRKPVLAGEEELAVNPRSRSAKLRFVEKL